MSLCTGLLLKLWECVCAVFSAIGLDGCKHQGHRPFSSIDHVPFLNALRSAFKCWNCQFLLLLGDKMFWTKAQSELIFSFGRCVMNESVFPLVPMTSCSAVGYSSVAVQRCAGWMAMGLGINEKHCDLVHCQAEARPTSNTKPKKIMLC